MNRKTLIVLVSIIAVMCVGVGFGVYALYSGVSDDSYELSLSDDDFRLFQAVPSDAVAVMHFDRLDKIPQMFSDSASAGSCFVSKGFKEFLASVSSAVESRQLQNLKSSETVVSFHYEGSPVPLLVVDICRAGASLPEDFYTLRQLASDAGYTSQSLDCSKLADGKSALSSRTVLLLSPSDLVITSSERHISQGISVLDKDEFRQAAYSGFGGSTLFLSNQEITKILPSFLDVKYRKKGSFLKSVSDWCLLSLNRPSETRFELSGRLFAEDGFDRYLNVLRSDTPSESKLMEILPSYTVSFFDIPVSDVNLFADACARFADSTIGRMKYDQNLDALGKRTGVKPQIWAESLDIKELALASFCLGDELETLLLVRPGNPDPRMIFGQSSDIESIGKYVPSVSGYPYFDYASALFGSLFDMGKDACCTYISGWIVAGSKAAVSEYVEGRALDTTLKSYFAGTSSTDLADLRSVDFAAYLSLSDNLQMTDRFFSPAVASLLREQFSSATFCPSLLKITTAKSGQSTLSLISDRISDIKTKAPEVERNATVEVPAGPFKVKNCATGKMNSFYQQENMYLCLKDENGKGLWAVPFQTPLCGRVCNVDYLSNGKLQFLFASGTKIHLIDRLGRFVKPFPVDLGKDILLGPDVYDFSGARKYNILVLHTDNTIDMYNLQGAKPKDWKGITAPETIMNLPEKLTVSGKTYWIVRTSLQTLVFPFYGGEPLSAGEKVKIRPDSPVATVESGIELTGYDGRKYVIKML